ncbi:AAA family ATPase [Epibacterium sp. SM1969]|uniref:AAA family ATPase n=1 Tax=Tritonibacter aquimaris TaxID=2663379 RepID=A0A844B0P9_9RHOB|nr:AAA family ATPase [Tritonibacter aquimaris]MQY44124.1 AAA family ATPase [Tritonibacter aquimaris]
MSAPSDLLYAAHFGMTERPFSLVPDPAYLFWSKEHKRAFAVLEYALFTQAPIALVTGEIGAGKTTLLQELLSRLGNDVTVGLVSNAQGGRGELIQWILNALYVKTAPEASYVEMFQALQDHLLTEYANGRRVVLVFDEAQNLSMEGLEELRMLTNINSNKDVLVQLVLVGQPELRDMVMNPKLEQLFQRIASNYHLSKMSRSTMEDYIRHRLKIAGGSGEEFDPEVFDLIFAETGGTPRLVNQLCDFSLLYAWSSEEPKVSLDTVTQLLDDGVYMRRTRPSKEEAV